MRERGQRLKRAIHVAREQAGIRSDVQLAQRANVHYDTLMNWYRGDTVPRGAELAKVAAAVGVERSELLAAYEGKSAEPDIVIALRDLAAEVEALRTQQHEATLAILRAVAALSGPAQEPQETSDDIVRGSDAGSRPGARP